MEVKDVEGIHPPSPIQEAILSTSSDPRSACGQLECLLEGPLDVGAFEKAAAQTAARHTVLRTLFLWKRVDRPLQVVHRQQRLVLERHDWRALPAGRQQEQLQNLLRREREQGFDLGKAPLVRVNLCAMGEAAHRLVVTYHRTILDKESARLFVSDLLELYASGGEEKSPQGAAYSDYLAWLKSRNGSDAEDFWRQALSDVRSPTPLAMERHAAPSRDEPDDYAEQTGRLSAELTARIERIVAGRELCAAALLHATWALLLSRYCGEQEVIFGTRVDTCPAHLQDCNALGPFMNALPIRLGISSELSVKDWLERIEAELQSVHRHAHSSLASIHRLADPPVATALFESCVDVRAGRAGDMSGRRYGHIVLRDMHDGRPEFPLVLIGDLDSGTVRISYERRRFDDDMIARVLEHVEVLVDSLTSDLDQPLSAVSLLTEAARQQLLVDWNDTGKQYPADECIHLLFEAQVQKTPNVPAVTFEDEILTYQELNEQANRLAHHLQGLGVGPEVLVAICMERSIDMITGIVAVLKSGGAWVPLDPTYPTDRLAFMLEDASPPVLLTQERVLDRLPSHWGQVVCVDTIRDELANESKENPTSAVGPDNLAYVMYTSGSTGKPKGAMVHHRGICNTSHQMVEIFDQKPGTRLLQFASASFDMSVLDILPALISGETLCLARQESMLGESLGRLLEEQKIQALTIPPSVLATVPELALPDLEIVRVAGEAVTADLVARWLPGRRIYNAYGPAEGSIWASGAFVDNSRPPHIGRPIGNVQIYVLDAALRPVPVGVPGELCFGGVGVGRGYLNRASLTAEKFVPNPFSREAGERLYRTGDLVRYLPDGNLDFLGRIDEQVKVHGFRIELGEIEATLAGHPSVSQAAVVLREDGSGEKRLVAYVVPRAGQDVTAGDLRRYLRTKLPAPMVPTAFTLLDSMPLTVNGKLDRKALPAPESHRPDPDAAFVEPRNQTEEAVAKIFAEVLGVERVSVTDNFFDLGGHSLLATQLLSRIRVALGIDLPLAQIFRGPTVVELSELIAKNNDQDAALQLPPIAAVPRRSQQKEQVLHGGGA